MRVGDIAGAHTEHAASYYQHSLTTAALGITEHTCTTAVPEHVAPFKASTADTSLRPDVGCSELLLRLQNDTLYLLYKLPTVVISRRTDQYSKAHEILTGVAASAAKRPRTAPMLPSTAASVPPPGMLQRDSMGNPEGPKLAHASTAPEGVHTTSSAL